ncbi:SGNH/GDSL hydrolase family protein [Pseudomonas sp. 14P_8.1_Bac3]|uniref:SGNH/GDSL hydrolase family protein n=1 Tax=Pseudomonas sp. 14P_8.1_Bac3 TaxID=2971621 RepID=UPI0021C66DFB|nr:SGNH/GDSL hydrolase family protein [Pseudomonas sp. 14P_8.1_Bac3]MCU1758715.1 SGNH/GDSL hydrolase family protein [Pseudomonas sp. 14P_8.1_Bac3]
MIGLGASIWRGVKGVGTVGGSVALPAPTTVNFTAAQVSPGFTGSVSTAKNAARIYARGALTLWSGWITGTEAKLTNPSDFGDNPGSMEVAIDGGAFSAAPNVASLYTLFTGLPHATRFVEVRWVEAMGDAPYIASSGNVLAVTGQPPALATLSNKIQVGADSSIGLYSAAALANSATYTPALQAPKGETYGSNVGSVKIKGAFTKLVLTLNGNRKVGVSKNGAAPIFYAVADEAGAPPRALIIPCDGSTSTYNVWDDGNFKNGGSFAVAVDSTFLDIGTRRRLDQYGDSITYGSGPGATSSDTETMRVAAAMGFVGSTNGISGLTVGAGKTMLDAVLPLRTVNSTDAAILALGGNNAADGIDATEQADYGLCIDKLLAKGYGKVLCRGILPSTDGSSTLSIPANAALKAVVDAKANPNVIWIETATWSGYEVLDGTHPTAAGYATVAGYALPAYTAALGL